MQVRQIGLNRPPYNAYIDLVVAMGQQIAHVVGKCQGQVRVRCHKFGGRTRYVLAGLANDLKVSDDRILHQRIGQKCSLVQAASVALDACNRLQDMT